MGNEQKSEKAQVNWASLVPELFYDLIGRVRFISPVPNLI